MESLEVKSRKKHMFWGYLHTEGTIHIKRYHSQNDIVDGIASPFCKHVVGPILAPNREEGAKIISQRLLTLEMRADEKDHRDSVTKVVGHKTFR
jgi:hypothetical protein